MAHKLNNYLRTYRKRAGLSQKEMTFLLGCRGSATISRYERSARQPNLQAAFVYEAVFRTPARELFAGVFQEVERTTVKRARALARKLTTAKPDRLTTFKLQVLRAVASGPVPAPNDHS